MTLQKSKIWTKRLTGLICASVLACIFTPPAQAEEVQHLRHSIRALGMGNAFTAVANDESALFYNPAGLESVKNYSFELVSLAATVNQNLLDIASADGSDATATLGTITGGKIYSEANASLLSFTAPGWGWSFFGSLVIDPGVHNPVVPYFDVAGFVQSGIAVGFSMNFMDQLLDVGVGLKSVSRTGIRTEVHIVDFLDDDFSSNIQDDFVDGKKQQAIDVGLIYHMEDFYNYQTKFGAVVKNIGGMDFGTTGTFPTTIDVGVASESEFVGLDVLVAADVVDIAFKNTPTKSLQRNFNVGAEFGMYMRNNGHHTLSARLGMKGGYASTGWTLNPPYIPITIDYAEWSEEIGTYGGSNRDKRKSLQLAINF
ncbi:MAG: hypothetical protein QNL04_06800 [SAR324 cluster bacterium]|nr:hypothetical protein [SAR324 cluster bacterium]